MDTGEWTQDQHCLQSLYARSNGQKGSLTSPAPSASLTAADWQNEFMPRTLAARESEREVVFCFLVLGFFLSLPTSPARRLMEQRLNNNPCVFVF